jgi:uncharacterized metal-binding protein
MTRKEDNQLPYLFLCHGAANVGQLGNDAARELFKEGELKIACIAAVGAHNPDFIKPFQSGKMVFCVDGCSMRCASKTLEHGNIPVINSMIVTDLGIEKNHDLNLNREELKRVKAGISSMVKGAASKKV